MAKRHKKKSPISPHGKLNQKCETCNQFHAPDKHRSHGNFPKALRKARSAHKDGCKCVICKKRSSTSSPVVEMVKSEHSEKKETGGHQHKLGMNWCDDCKALILKT